MHSSTRLTGSGGVVLAALALALLPTSPAMAASGDPRVNLSTSAPESAQSMWIDVDGVFDVAAVDITVRGGGSAATELPATRSAFGLVAISDVSPGSVDVDVVAHGVAIEAVAVTFADANGAIVGEVRRSTSPSAPAGHGGETVEPPAPAGGRAGAARAAGLAATGANVFVPLAAATLLLATGGTLALVRGRRRRDRGTEVA